MADDGTLAKVIFYNVVCQTRRPACITAVDTDNCYDQIAHPISFLVFQSMGIPITPTMSMLSTIQDIRFYLRIGYVNSKEFAQSTGGIKTQGLCQGNGAAPAGWTTTNITMINAHKRKDYGTHLVNPISKGSLHVIGSIFVDNTDLEHFDMSRIEMAEEAHAQFQESIINWGWLLIATGGALKPIKCFSQLISPSGGITAGHGSTKTMRTTRSTKTIVPLEDGSFAEIQHLNIDTPTKTLGSMTAPTGSNVDAIKQMKDKFEGWLAQAMAGKLHRRNFWFLVDKQFWPKVGYGIGTISAPFKELEEGLMRIYYDMLSIGGVRKSVRRELQQLDGGFYGIGLPHPGIECLLGHVNKLLLHYSSPTGLGKHQQVSMELSIVEAEVSPQPFLESYTPHSKWVIHSWIKSL